jgi:hypothetical protein
MNKIIIDLTYFVDLSKETALVGYSEGFHIGKMIKFNTRKSYLILIPENIIAINKSFLKGFLSSIDDLEEMNVLEQLTFNREKTNDRVKEIIQNKEMISHFKEHSYENDDLSAIFSQLIEIDKLNEKIEKNKYITSNDIDNAGVVFFIKWVMILNYNLNWDYSEFYLVNDKKYEFKKDIPLSDKDKAIKCYEFSEDYLNTTYL